MPPRRGRRGRGLRTAARRGRDPARGADGGPAALRLPARPDRDRDHAPPARRRATRCRCWWTGPPRTRRSSPRSRARAITSTCSAYILEDDAVGRKYRDALIERARAGVRVRVMFDSVGGLLIGPAFREAARAGGRGGARVRADQPDRGAGALAGLRAQSPQAADRRRPRRLHGRHRHQRHLQPVSASGSSEYGWRDTNIRITGPAVAEFQHLFLETGRRRSARSANEPRYLPAIRAERRRAGARGRQGGRGRLRAGARARSRGWCGACAAIADRHAIYASYLAAISESRRRVWITQAYFAPNPEFRDALEAAARRGGRRARCSCPPTATSACCCTRRGTSTASCSKPGVRIFEYEGPVLHAKTAVVDGVWSTVGSSNLDYRSFIHNDEANAIIVGHAFAREMERDVPGRPRERPRGDARRVARAAGLPIA